MSNPLAIPKTLSSTGTARRWAKNTLLSVRDKRESNKPVAADETELRRLPGTHPSHGPINVSGTLPRRKRRHLTGNATPLNQPGPTSRWNAAHPWVPNEKKEIIDWDNRKKQFEQLVHQAKNKAQQYDCLIPVSGGKDSTWQVIKALEYGLNPLCVTWKTPARNLLGAANLQNLIH